MMKRSITYFAFFGLIFSMLSGSCGRGTAGRERETSADTTGTARIMFTTMEHNFGTVRVGQKVGCIFSFTNTGDADLILTSATASCGCTVPKYEKKPVPPGGKGSIEVIFDTSGRSGIQSKTVVVQSNAENNLIILRIVANIETDKTNINQ